MVLLQYLCDFTKWQTPLHCREDSLHAFFYKQPSCYGSNVKNGLKVKQLAKQPSTFGWSLSKTKKYFFNYKFTEAKFLHNCFCVQQYSGQMLVTIEKLLILCLYAMPMKLEIAKQLLCNF